MSSTTWKWALDESSTTAAARGTRKGKIDKQSVIWKKSERRGQVNRIEQISPHIHGYERASKSQALVLSRMFSPPCSTEYTSDQRRRGDQTGDVLESPECAWIQPVRECTVARSGVVRTDTSFEKPQCWRRWVRKDPPDTIYLVRTSITKSVAVPHKCDAGRSRKVRRALQEFVLELVDYGSYSKELRRCSQFNWIGRGRRT